MVPTYDERENLPALAKRVHRALWPRVGYELIVVDDDSPDGMGDLAELISKDRENG